MRLGSKICFILSYCKRGTLGFAVLRYWAFFRAHFVAVKPRAVVVIVPWIEPKCTSIRHVPDRIQGRGVSPIGYLCLVVGLRGGEGAPRTAIWIGGF